MYGHERSLVQRYQNRPFVLLGVNTDDNAATLKRVQRKQNVTWRSWSDGPPGGPLCAAWHVTSFPTIFLIDPKGVVRYEHHGTPGAEALDNKIEMLVREAEK